MRFHFSSASTLALATAATLTLPLSASAADFAYRNGQKVAASLELPLEGANLIVNEGVAEQAGVHNATGISSGFAKSGAGQLILSGESLITAPVTIQAGLLNVTGTLTAPLSIVSGALNVDGQIGAVSNSALGSMTNNGHAGAVTSLGNVVNNKYIDRLTMNGGSATNNVGASIFVATISAGEMLNNGVINSASVAAGAGFVSNKGASVRYFANNGISANDGSMQNVSQQGGSFANGANASIYGLSQYAGVSTNDGKIVNANLQSGSLTNNASGTIAFARIAAGSLINGGAITSVNVEALGNITNNLSGTIDTLTNAGTVDNAGTVANGGQIGTVTQSAGSITNNGTILGEATINGGTITNNKALGTVTIADGASFVNNRDGIARSLTNFGTASSDGTIQFLTQNAGNLVNEANGTISGLTQTGGSTTNSGTINQAAIENGTFANNTGSTIGQANLAAGLLANSGVVTSMTIAEGGTLANNANGFIGTLTSSGEASSAGLIGTLEVVGGAFNNSGRIRETVSVGFNGVFSSTGFIGAGLSNFGQANLAGSIGGQIDNEIGATLNLTGDLAGEGTILNDGTINSSGARTVTGFETLNNAGVMNIVDDLSIVGDLVSSGTVRLTGNNAGGDSLTVDGDLTLGQSSETSLDIGSDGTSDTVSVSGDLTLGGRLNVLASGADYGLKSTYDTFTGSAGKVTGRFTDVVISGATGLFGTLEDAATGMVLAIRNRDVLNAQLETLDLGENGKILTDLTYHGAEGANLFDTLATIDAADAPSLISQITGAATSALVNVGNNAAEGFGNLMQKVATASGVRSSNTAVLAYENARLAEENAKFEPVLRQGQGAVGFWARGFGETGSSNGSGGSTLGGVGAGVEVAMGERLTIGASVGYSMARFGHSTAVEGKTNSFHGGAYVAMGATAPEATGFGLTASGSYSKHDTRSQRTIKFSNLTSVASANYGGSTIAGEVMVRNGFTIGDKMPLTIAPVAGLKFAMDNDDNYTETGAGGLNLTVSGSKRKSLVGVVGLQLASRIETESVVFTPHISGVYQHEFLDTSSTTTRTLGNSAASFTVKQGGGSRSSIALEAGLGMRFAGGLALDVSGYGVISADENRYGATATLKAGF